MNKHKNRRETETPRATKARMTFRQPWQASSSWESGKISVSSFVFVCCVVFFSSSLSPSFFSATLSIAICESAEAFTSSRERSQTQHDKSDHRRILSDRLLLYAQLDICCREKANKYQISSRFFKDFLLFAVFFSLILLAVNLDYYYNFVPSRSYDTV